MRKVLVLGAGGFIGSHLANRLADEGYYVVGADLVVNDYAETRFHEMHLVDLRDQQAVADLIKGDYLEIYQLASDMGGAGYVFRGDHDAQIMSNSALININVLRAAQKSGVARVFFSSSACVYGECDARGMPLVSCSEDQAYPAGPDSEYGWEKLFAERLYQAFGQNHGMVCKIARLHNVYGPHGIWRGGREKAPAAICRKVAEAMPGGSIQIWGDGQQTRSFLYIDDCIAAIRCFMEEKNFNGPVNIGSDRRISINDLASRIIELSGKNLKIEHIKGPVGVRHRNSDNRLAYSKLPWKPRVSLETGIRKLYRWVSRQVASVNLEVN